VAGAAAPGVPPDFFSQRGGSPTIVSRRGRDDPPLPPAKTNAGPGVALLPTEAVLTLLRRLAAALATLHAEGIVHRDIKPSNIFLVDGLVSQSKLIDLGLARNLLNPGDVTRTGLLVGTPRYMAPEQARCDAHVTAAADVWAVGCVAYECLSGQSPFDGDDLADMFARILHDEPAALTGRGLDAPELLLGLVHRMLSKDPAERPRDGAALVDELEIILASERMAGRAVAVRSPDGTYDGMHAAEEEGLVPASGSSLRDLERRVGCSLFAAAGYDADDVARFEAAVAAASLRASSCWSVPPSPSAPAHRASSAWVVRLPVSGTTVDLAHRAVRLALQLARELPGWSFALTTGFFPVVSGGDSDAGDEAPSVTT
jgi:serine/threonine protein kinase